MIDFLQNIHGKYPTVWYKFDICLITVVYIVSGYIGHSYNEAGLYFDTAWGEFQKHIRACKSESS